MISYTIKIQILLCILVITPPQSLQKTSTLLRGNFSTIAESFGYKTEEYDVVTEDGYILSLFHIPGGKQTVLLMHGVIDSADTFIIRGNNSLALTLARSGYDVWVGNIRGTRYSRRHVRLDPDKDKKFWDFSYHEEGYYDLPAMIDCILHKTGKKTLSAIGHSQGNAIFYVLGSTRPEYNQKIKVFIALSPICFFNNVKPPISTLFRSLPLVADVLEVLGQEEVLGDETSIRTVTKLICGSKESYGICVTGFLFPIAGKDPAELEPDFFPTVIAHYPTGTSRKNGVHIIQGYFNNGFAQFDYGSRNMEVYNSVYPPQYDLGKVTMKVVLLAGRNDALSPVKDVKLLRDRLPNVEYRLLDYKNLNHLDFVWGRHMDKYLYPHIFDSLERYGS